MSRCDGPPTLRKDRDADRSVGTERSPQAGVSSTAEQAIRAADAAAVAVFAYRDTHGRPLAWPVTPYVEGSQVVVTSTLAFVRKAVSVRRDGRVALLAGGIHMTGEATVEIDSGGDRFVAHFLDQELRKYPPARDIVRLPLARVLFWWFFGRVFIRFAPQAVHERHGDDAATLVTLNELGFPSIVPIEEPPIRDDSFVACGLGSDSSRVAQSDAQAAVLLHSEPTMKDLRQLLLRGELGSRRFRVSSRHGSLEPAAGGGVLGELRRQVGYHRRALRARSLIRLWGTEDTTR